MASETLEDALVEELRDMLHAEKQLVKALPKMARAAENEELRTAFKDHLEETKEQVSRIESSLEAMGKATRAKPCEGMKGILAEGEEIIEKNEAGPVRDAMLIAAAQKSEHYEIASYGTILAWAKQLDQDLGDLETTLDEEKAANEKLNEIAESLNVEADVA